MHKAIWLKANMMTSCNRECTLIFSLLELLRLALLSDTLFKCNSKSLINFVFVNIFCRYLVYFDATDEKKLHWKEHCIGIPNINKVKLCSFPNFLKTCKMGCTGSSVGRAVAPCTEAVAPHVIPSCCPLLHVVPFLWPVLLSYQIKAQTPPKYLKNNQKTETKLQLFIFCWSFTAEP